MLLQPRQVDFIVHGDGMDLLQEHDHVDGCVGDAAVGVQVVVVENDGLRQVVGTAGEDVAQDAVGGVVFAAFHSDGQHDAIQLDDEIELASCLSMVLTKKLHFSDGILA